MKLIRTERFAQAYRALQPHVREKVKKSLYLLAVDAGHPSLRLKKTQGMTGIWEARVDRGIRMTLEVRDDCYILRNVGKHDETLRKP